jgi:hypothetical protein
LQRFHSRKLILGTAARVYQLFTQAAALGLRDVMLRPTVAGLSLDEL